MFESLVHTINHHIHSLPFLFDRPLLRGVNDNKSDKDLPSHLELILDVEKN